MIAAGDDAAAEWLRVHHQGIPAELPAQLEPTQRGHRGHAHATMDAELVACGNDPLDWIIAEETLRERIAHTTRRDALLLRDARDALDYTGRRVAGWTGADASRRTLERRRAATRAAAKAGQLDITEGAA